MDTSDGELRSLFGAGPWVLAFCPGGGRPCGAARGR